MREKIVVILVGSSVLALATSRAQDAKFAADSLKYSHDSYAKVHLVAIANLDFGDGGTVEFKYDRYPNGGPERIQAGNGEEFAWKDVIDTIDWSMLAVYKKREKYFHRQ